MNPTTLRSANPVRSPLAVVTAAIIAAATPAAFAGTVGGGAVATVNPGDPPETWTLTGASTLNVNSGAVANRTVATGGSFVNVTGGLITHSGSGAALQLDQRSVASFNKGTLSSSTGTALFLLVDEADLVGSKAVFEDSAISGVDQAVRVSSGSSLSLSNSSLTGTGGTGAQGALTTFGGSVTLKNGTVVNGNSHGLSIRMDNQGPGGTAPDRPGDGEVLVDASRISATVGSAIHVQSDSDGTLSTANIRIRNGSTLQGGDGNILTVAQGSATNRVTVANFSVEGSTLNGNVLVASDGSIGNVELNEGGRINGSMTNVARATIGAGGYWQLSGNSNVATLALGSGGIVDMGNGSSFNSLRVSGDFSGGGTLVFNTVLAGDASPTDRLIVEGDTSGRTFVRVNNVGGGGAATTKGIEVISVGGTSNGQFDLQGRAIGGQYEYFLVKDGANWFLRSQAPTPVDPCLADPTLPGCSGTTPPVDPVDPPVVPVLRPEPGAYLSNLRAAEMMFRTDYHSRHSGQNQGHAWARVDGNRNSYDALNRQLEITGNSQALHVGLDLVTNDSGSAFGVMLASGNASSTTRSHVTEYSARGKVRGEAIGVYGTIRKFAGEDPYGGLYVDGWLQRQQFRNKVEGAGLSVERYDSKAWQGAVEAGYAFRLSGDPIRGGLYLEPQIQVGYTDISSDPHVEENGTIVEAVEAGGMFTRTGLRLSGVERWERKAALVQPYVEANWIYNKRDDAVLFDNELVDNRIPASKLEIGAGASIKFASGVGVWAGLAIQSASGYRSTSGQIGLNYSW